MSDMRPSCRDIDKEALWVDRIQCGSVNAEGLFITSRQDRRIWDNVRLYDAIIFSALLRMKA